MAASRNKAWIIAADMGYGHQRAAFPLRYLAGGRIINANNYPGIPRDDRHLWKESREFYEFISRFKRVPLIGDLAFEIFDKLQSIPRFYPRRDLSRPTQQVRQLDRLIRQRRWGYHLIKKLEQRPLPIVTSFFVPALMADIFRYPGDIYCLVTDTDISRAWVALKPNLSRINYLAPNFRVMERLRLYGVPANRLFLTGFPLPLENLGGAKIEVLQHDLKQRLKNLDPHGNYWQHYGSIYKHYLGGDLPEQSDHPFTITFAVGGAGAQRELGVVILKSLKHKIKQGRLRLVLVAGIHNEVNKYFRQAALANGLGQELGHGVVIIHASNKYGYFSKFNKILRTTDVLWTKPSELSFYVALGIPLIMSESIGSQEEFNRSWIDMIGAGTDQKDPQFTDQWLFDLLDSGWLAEAAMEGFIEAPKFGTFNIEKIILHKLEEVKEFRTVLHF